MKWLSLVLVLVALLVPIWGQIIEGPDYTSRYAQMASPLPADVDVNELLTRLTSSNMQ